MLPLVIYTFASFKYKNSLIGFTPHVFVFNKPKQDFARFCELITSTQPAFILGLANNPGHHSQIETRTINRFHKTKKIDRLGKDYYPLYIPSDNHFKLSDSVTDTFCNYTMYKTAQYLGNHLPTTKFSFIHLSSKDKDILDNLLSKNCPFATTY